MGIREYTMGSIVEGKRGWEGKKENNKFHKERGGGGGGLGKKTRSKEGKGGKQG